MLISYEDLPLWKFGISVNEMLEGQYISFYTGLPCISVLDLFGSLLACMSYRQQAQFPKSWLETLVACTFLQFGGTTITGIVLGQTPSWVTSSTAFPALLLAWGLIFFCPLDLFYIYTKDNKLIIFFWEIGAAVSAGHAVTSWGMDKAIWNTYHSSAFKLRDSVLTCLLCGTFSACGGGLIGYWLGFYRSPSFTITSTPAVFSISNQKAPTTLYRSFILAVIYYGLLNPTQYLPWRRGATEKESAHLVIGVLQLMHCIFTQLSSDLDIYAHIATTLAIQVNPKGNTIGVQPPAAKVVDLKPGVRFDSPEKEKNTFKKE